MDWWLILICLAGTLFIGLLLGRGSTDVLRARIEMLELQLKSSPPRANPKAHPNRVVLEREAIPRTRCCGDWVAGVPVWRAPLDRQGPGLDPEDPRHGRETKTTPS